MQVRLVDTARGLLALIAALLIGFSGGVLAQDADEKEPQLCRGNYHSEEAAK